MINKIKRALISVTDKSNIKQILKILKKYNVKIISSGGTFKEIKRLGYNCEEISKYTNSDFKWQGENTSSKIICWYFK